jgi:hypothetical protein
MIMCRTIGNPIWGGVRVSNQTRLKELVEKGKNHSLSNKELLEMIQLVGPDKALQAVTKK